MKRQKIICFKASDGAVKIDIDLICADVQIESTRDKTLSVHKLRHSHIKVSEHNGVIKIKQTRKPRFHRAQAKIFIPLHCVPDIKAEIGIGKICVYGGLYGDLSAHCGDAKIELVSSAFADAEINGRSLSLNCSEISVKRSFGISAFEGDFLIENSYCTALDCNCRTGDVGTMLLRCKDSSFTVDKGSINLSFDGSEDDYSLHLLSRNGLCNRADSCDGDNTVKAYINKGNIVVDFSKKKESENGHDHVSEDTRVALVS